MGRARHRRGVRRGPDDLAAGRPLFGFTAAHSGGADTPVVCLHGFMDTWRTWELVLAMLDTHLVGNSLRVLWGTDDGLLEWPTAAARFRTDWLPHADWVVLDGVGHCPQLDVPLETAQLILGFASS